MQKLLTQSETIFDTEGAAQEEIKIGEQDVTIVRKKEVTQVYWTDMFNSYSVISTVKPDELVKMPKSVIEPKYNHP